MRANDGPMVQFHCAEVFNKTVPLLVPKANIRSGPNRKSMPTDASITFSLEDEATLCLYRYVCVSADARVMQPRYLESSKCQRFTIVNAHRSLLSLKRFSYTKDQLQFIQIKVGLNQCNSMKCRSTLLTTQV